MTEAELGDVLKVLVVVVALPLTVVVTIALGVVTRRAGRAVFVPGPEALRARRGLAVLRVQFVFSMAITLLVIVFAIVFVNNDLKVPFLTPEQTRILTRGGLLILSSVPSAYFIRRLIRRDDPSDDGRVARLVARLQKRMDSQDVRQDEQDVRMDEQDDRIENPPSQEEPAP